MQKGSILLAALSGLMAGVGRPDTGFTPTILPALNSGDKPRRKKPVAGSKLAKKVAKRQLGIAVLK